MLGATRFGRISCLFYRPWASTAPILPGPQISSNTTHRPSPSRNSDRSPFVLRTQSKGRGNTLSAAYVVFVTKVDRVTGHSLPVPKAKSQVNEAPTSFLFLNLTQQSSLFLVLLTNAYSCVTTAMTKIQNVSPPPKNLTRLWYC